MGMTANEFLMAIHGTILWTIFLLGVGAGFVALLFVTPEMGGVAGFERRVRRLLTGTWVAAASAWLAVLTGSYLYSFYRANPPEGAKDLAKYPRAYLRANPDLAEWHDGMEWKQMVAWLAPILATAVAYVATRYGARLAREEKIRRALIVLLAVAFFAAAVAAIVGTFINKVVPIR